MVVTDQATYADPRRLNSGGQMAQPVIGTSWLKVLWDSSTNPRVYVYVTQLSPTETTPEKALTARAQDLSYLEDQIESFAAMLDARLIDVTVPPQVGPAATAADIKSTVVSDGMNYLLAISNLNQFDPVSCTLTLPIQRRVNGYEYHAVQVTSSELAGSPPTGQEQPLTGSNTSAGFDVELSFAPRETKLVYLGVDTSSGFVVKSDMEAESRKLRQALQGIPAGPIQGAAVLNPSGFAGFDTEAGIRALDYIDAMLAQPTPILERCLAGLVQLSNMVFLEVDRVRDTAALRAARINLDSYGTPVPVDGEVQILHVLNGQEEQDVGMTASGSVRATIGATTHKHWHFGALSPSGATAPQYVTNLGGLSPDLSPVEVHFHDPLRGTETFVTATADVVLPLPRGPVSSSSQESGFGSAGMSEIATRSGRR
jgi:hypothetical protein